MSVETMRGLHETFRAYVSAEAAVTRAFIGYKFGEVSEREVHRLQKIAADAAEAHIESMNGTVNR